MAAPSRKARLESLLHREIAACVQRELRDPRLGFVTILRVELSDDLHLAKAWWSTLGDAKARRLAQAALEAARPFVQSRYAPAVRTRTLPTLSFHYDEGEARRGHLDELIRRARSSDSDGGARPEPPVEQQPPTPQGH
jgi:ribosome-binding factor A